MSSFCNDPFIKNTVSNQGIEIEGVHHDFLSCGSYYFDGHFNVVKMPAGTIIYHGSAILANKLIVYPVGVRFYDKEFKVPDTMKVISADKEIEEIISENDNTLVPSWYGDLPTAKLYSSQVVDNPILRDNCGQKCILAFKLKKDAVFLLLKNEHNLKILLDQKNNLIPPTMKIHLSNMFNNIYQNSNGYYNFNDVKTGNVALTTLDGTPLNSIQFTVSPVRTSYRDQDIPFTEYMCKNMFKERGYAGYINPAMVANPPSNWFHSEIIFCNPFEYLTRDYSNPNDWQYQLRNPSKPTLNYFIDNMKMYKTTDINKHSGNLYEHSVWSLLWVEYLMTTLTQRVSTTLPDMLLRLIGITAFLHNIGKMNPKATGKKDFIYFKKDDHIINAQKYLTPQDPAIRNLLKELDLPDDELVNIMKLIIKNYNIFVTQFSATTNNQNVYDNFLKAIEPDIKRLDTPTRKFIILATILVGGADILATVPFGIDDLAKIRVTSPNQKSSIIPDISNVSSIYRGNRDKIDTNGIVNRIIDIAYKIPK